MSFEQIIKVTEEPVEKKEKKSLYDKEGTFVELKIIRSKPVIENLLSIIKKNGFICGGFARVCCSKREDVIPSNDIDIYSKTKEDFDILKNRFIDMGFIKGKESEAAISFRYSLPLQLIKPLDEGNIKLVGTVEEILSNFDFTIARSAIFIDDNDKIKAIGDSDFIEDDNANRIVIKNIHCPISEVYRISKYSKKGYFVPIKEIVKLFIDWDNRDDEYKTKLFNFLQKEKLTKEDIEELEALLHID